MGPVARRAFDNEGLRHAAPFCFPPPGRNRHERTTSETLTMHAHDYPTPERTQAPAQMLRGVANACARLAGGTARSRVLRGSSRRSSGSASFACGTIPSRKWNGGLDRDFGSFVGGRPV
jgi:hypothetical protein